MQGQGGLAILVGGEVLRHGDGDRLVARHDALNQPPHGFDAQRQRGHVQQQDVVLRAVTGQLLRLDGGAQRHHFVGVQVVQRRGAKEGFYRPLHLGHAGGAAHHHHALHFFTLQASVAQGLAHGSHGAGRQVAGGSIKVGGFDIKMHLCARQTGGECY